LAAELGSAFLCGQAGIMERTIDNSAAYLKGWLSRLKSDGTFIMYAAPQAQKAHLVRNPAASGRRLGVT